VLASAFANDPALSHVFPDRAVRTARLPRFFDLILRSEADPALTDIAGDNAAAAVWRPPGAWQTSTATMLRLTIPLLTTFGTALPRALRLQGLLEAHHPATPHWYLEFLGTDAARQGQGFGGAAARARLARCDAEGMPAALETATQRNLGLYTALGFAVTHEFDVPNGPHFWCMWREPR